MPTALKTVTSAEPVAEVEEITPTIAATMLAANTKNRNLRGRLVEVYAKDMAKGAWQFTGESIKFAEDGSLLDGQHRLAAVVQSGCTVRLLVVRGLPAETQEVMDTGTKRTPSDALRLRGENNAVIMSSVAKMILSEGGKIRVRPSTSDLIAVVEEDATLRWVINNGLNGLGGLKRIITPAVLGYAYWRLHAVDTFACAEFFSRLDSLTELTSGSPILALHRRLASHVRTSSGETSRREALAYIFMAWNAWRRNEPRAIVKLAYSGGQLSVPDPI
jgi:hypothetical protein